MLSFRVAVLMLVSVAPSPTVAGKAPLVDIAAPFTNDERGRVIVELADALERGYVDPRTGARYAEVLRARLAQGAYDRTDDPAVFAEKVTSDLQTIAADPHLRVGLKEGFRRPRRLPNDIPRSARPNGPPGLEKAAMLPGGIAYLRFNEFPDEPRSATDARAFLLAHADARAVIIDCRPNRGGGTSVMNAILPLFYTGRTVQIRMDTRATAEAGTWAEADPTLVRRPSPAGIVRYDHVIEADRSETRLRRVPLYYLTSRRTASAAEHLAFALRRNHRATIVGEVTAGANHYGEELPLGTRFLVFLPVGRSYDPETGKDWEGTGISPDVFAPADAALSVATALANKITVDKAAKRAR